MQSLGRNPNLFPISPQVLSRDFLAMAMQCESPDDVPWRGNRWGFVMDHGSKCRVWRRLPDSLTRSLEVGKAPCHGSQCPEPSLPLWRDDTVPVLLACGTEQTCPRQSKHPPVCKGLLDVGQINAILCFV